MKNKKKNLWYFVIINYKQTQILNPENTSTYFYQSRPREGDLILCQQKSSPQKPSAHNLSGNLPY